MTMISYAQNQEDVRLDRVFPRGRPGFYIDVGANEPVTDSVTKHFYDLGWHGVNVEPAGAPFELLCAERDRDVNLNVALSDVEGEVTFYEFPVSTASTASKEQAQRNEETGLPIQERTVKAMTLAQLCEAHVGDRPIDFLSIDVESHEREVLAGGDWTRWRPRVVIVEATEPTTTIPSHERWESILLDAGYLFAAFDGLNRYYVASEEADLLAVIAIPANVTDDYVPYRYHRQIEHMTWATDLASRHMAAAQAVNESLRREVQGFATELADLRAHYERLERSLTAARAEMETLREEVAAAPEESAQAALDGISPAALAIGRRLTGLSAAHPKAAEATKKALRLGLQAKRSLTDK